MGPKLTLEGIGEKSIKRVDFDNNEKTFSLHVGNGSDEEYTIYIEYGFEKSDDTIGDTWVEILTHPNHPENDVRRLELKDADRVNTVGWLCTVGALASGEHDYFDNVYFRRAAFMAISVLLNDCVFTKKPVLSHDSHYKLSDLLDEELSIIVLHRPSVCKVISSDLNEILPCLHQYAFMPYDGEFRNSSESNEVAISKFKGESPKIKLKPISSDTQHKEFVIQVFRNLLLTAHTPLMKFFIYYQLIELLSSIVFSNTQSKIIEQMQSVKNSPLEIHPLLKKLNENGTEKKRINLLFNDYSNLEGDLLDLKMVCNSFLTQCELPVEETAAMAVYTVRNVIFHNLRRVPDHAESDFISTVELLGDAVTELLIKFKIPG